CRRSDPDGATDWTISNRSSAEAATQRRFRYCAEMRDSRWRPYAVAFLPQGDELSASSQVVCGGAAQLSRSAVAVGGIRHVLPLREKWRVVRAHARAFATDE